MHLRTAIFVLPALLAPALAHGDDREWTPAQIEFFEKQVRPVLADHCFECHGPDTQEAGLRLDSRAALLKGGETGPAIVPGKPEKSELIDAINYGADGFQMPPTGKLKPEHIAALTEWVRQGAPWPGATGDAPVTSAPTKFDLRERAKHWSFQPVAAHKPPTVARHDWPRTAIDNFLLAKLESARLTAAAEADRRTLIRRVTFDLTGLPPTTDEIDAFLADESPDAFETLVDRLLASPLYGERWARHWLDLVRYAETLGHEFDFEILEAWRYRDYVVRALNADLSYNEFVTEHIAGDLLPRPRRDPVTGHDESIIATGFWWLSQGKHSPVDIRAEECDRIDNQLDVFGKTFLGLTIACARCHDHKFDPITANDYYALAGYIQSSRQQWAFIDDPAPRRRIINEITRHAETARPALTAAAADAVAPALAKFADALRLAIAAPAKSSPLSTELHEAAVRDPAHPLHPWAVLGRVEDAAFTARRQQLLQQLRDRHTAAAADTPQTIIFEDFTAETFEGWTATGEAFGARPSRSGDLLLRPDDPQPLREVAIAGLAHSGLVSRHLQGILRSKTFLIEKPFIWYRVRRDGGRPNPGRQNKNGQLHVIVDGFQIIRSPLYGSLSINVPNDRGFTWHRHDVSKFVGTQAYLEIEDVDDGWIAVDRIVFTDAGPPPDAPNAAVLDLLDDDTLTTPATLATAYQRLFTKTLGDWSTGRLETAAQADDQIALLNWALTTPALERTIPNPQSEFRNLHSTLARLESQLTPPTRALAIADGTPENEGLLIRGNHKKPGDEVPRRFLEVFGGEPAANDTGGSGRLDLARRMTDPANPLLARVLVNRLWQHHFGRGLVATPDDFGHMGVHPTHPELLDWLAAEFVRSGWSLKHMHRLMVTSAAYRMSSAATDGEAEAADPQNLLLHRMPVRRLEAEPIRDALLALSGRLDPRFGGPSVLPHLTPFMEGRGRPASGPLDGDGRRSLYVGVRRNFLPPMFQAFDFPIPTTTMGRRSVSNVPAQALTMMNNPFVVQQAELWARRVLREPHASREARIDRLYEMGFARRPTDDERTAALAFLDQAKTTNTPDDPRPWSDLCHVLLNVKEFVFVN